MDRLYNIKPLTYSHDGNRRGFVFGKMWKVRCCFITSADPNPDPID
jgi:hypothetical protein